MLVRTTIIVLFLALFSPSLVWAEEPSALDEEPSALEVDEGALVPQLEWDESWRRVQPWQYVAASAGLVGGFSSVLLAQSPQTWTGPILFDQWVIDTIGFIEPERRKPALIVSHIFFGGAMAYRLIDDVLVVGYLRNSPDVAWQMAWIDLQSFAFIASTLWMGQLVIGRERPATYVCRQRNGEDADCVGSRISINRSFYAGHPATVLAAAGQTCMHHMRLPIYGGGFWDGFACGAALLASGVEAFTRVASLMHYGTDLLAGTVFGLIAGWGIPALHYGWREDSESSASLPMVLPVFDDEFSGLVVRSFF